MAVNSRILVIPDLHMPYCHPCTWKFLKAVKQKYKPDRVVCLGDEVDGHGWSYHEPNQELDSAGPELEKAIRFLKPIYALFPNVDILESNHGSLAYRKARTGKIPTRYLKTMRDALEAPRGWKWHFELTLRMSNGQDLYCHHGKTSGQGKLSQRQSMCSVQGHYHSKFHITYWANPTALFWDAHAGCLVNNKSLAMEYGKNTLEKGIIGCLVILDGVPQLVPMRLNRSGRWIGKL